MLYTSPYPYGLDSYVEAANKRIYDYLKNLWGVNDNNYNSFGRALRNNVKGGYIPEYYNAATKGNVGGSGSNDAGGLFFEDSMAVVSFWGLVDPIKENENGDSVAKMQLILFVDTSKLTPGLITNNQGQRLDDVCVNDVRNCFPRIGCGFTPGDTYKDIDKVLERYSGTIKNRVLNKNIGKFFSFRLDLELRYNPALHGSKVPQRQMIPMNRSVTLFIKTTPDPAKKIAVGNGKYIYQEYAPGNTLTPTIAGTTTPYLISKNVQLLIMNNETDLLANWNTVTGVWDRNGQGTPYGFNDGDFAGILFTDLT